MRHSLRLILNLSFVLGVSVSAAETQTAEGRPHSEKYRLPELVELAVRSSPLFGSQDALIEETRLAASQARAWPGLSLDFSAGRKRQDSGAGPLYGAGLAQPLPVLGKPGLRGALLDAESEAWQVRRAASEISVTLEVVQLAYEYAVNRRKAGYVEKRQKRFELLQSYMAGRVFAAPQKKTESRIVQNRLKSLIADVLQSQAGFKSSLEKLRVYAPLETGVYPKVEVPWFAGNKSLDQNEWIAKALSDNPDIRLQKLSVKGAEVEKSLASREAWPDPALIASYEHARAADAERSFGLGLGLALPAWNGNRAGIKSAEQRRLSNERLLAFQERRLKAQSSRAVVEYEAARQTVSQYPEMLIADLEAQLREAEEGFRKGQIDLLTFLELENSASETFNRVLDAQLALVSKLAEVWRLSGERNIETHLGSF